MKKFCIAAVLALVMLGVSTSSAQFKSQVDGESRVSDGLMQSSEPTLFFGWFNPERFHMRHTIDMSYGTFDGKGMSLGTYTNSMMYEFADNLNARADVSLSFSPFGSTSPLLKKNDLSSIYLSRAELSYKPWQNVLVQVQYRQIPYGAYGYYSPFYNPWYRENGF